MFYGTAITTKIDKFKALDLTRKLSKSIEISEVNALNLSYNGV